jgi:hypothetical protein
MKCRNRKLRETWEILTLTFIENYIVKENVVNHVSLRHLLPLLLFSQFLNTLLLKCKIKKTKNRQD